MWCLLYLDQESATRLVSVLKEESFDAHLALDMDDLLDALWYHGSAVACIVIETALGNGLEDFVAALKGWPDLRSWSSVQPNGRSDKRPTSIASSGPTRLRLSLTG